MRYKTIIFDLDGTLTDSAEGIINTIKYSLDKAGINYNGVNLNTFIGPPLLDSYIAYLGINKDDALKAIEYYQERFSTLGKFENKVYAGVENMLKTLKSFGYTLLVATTKPEVFAIEILKHFHLFDYFDVVSGGSLDQKLSDKAEILKIAINRNKADYRSSIMIGDRKHDIIGAHKNNIPCIGVLYGYGNIEELKNASADYILESPNDIVDFFTK